MIFISNEMSVLSESEVRQVLINESVISKLGSLGFSVDTVFLEAPVNATTTSSAEENATQATNTSANVTTDQSQNITTTNLFTEEAAMLEIGNFNCIITLCFKLILARKIQFIFL